MMIAIKLLDKVLEVQSMANVTTHLKEIMLGLIKVMVTQSYVGGLV